MNLILKIVQGPNAGAEVALIEGMNVKLGKGDECDIVIADQTLPDVACEIEVGAERVMLLLPGGGQERMEPLHVKVFETTAIAIGPADGPWGTLVWPEEEQEEEETPENSEEEQPPPPPKHRKLQIALLVALVLVVVLEFLIWVFWPYLNAKITVFRDYCAQKFDKLTEDKLELAAQPVQRRSMEDLAKAYGVELVYQSEDEEHANETANVEVLPTIKGNLKTSAERLKLTAEAYSMKSGITIDLSDDESLRRASEEIMSMVAGNALKIDKAENRELAISGRLKDVDELRRVLEALKGDVPHIEKIDCSKVEIGASASSAAERHEAEGTSTSNNDASSSVSTNSNELPDKSGSKNQEASVEKAANFAVIAPANLHAKQSDKPSAPKQSNPSLAKLPIVGVMTMPIPYLVLRNGSRVLEGAEFGGFVVSKIGDDVILLKSGDETIEWRP